MGIYRKYISEENDMQTIFFRYAVVLDTLGIRLPNDIKCENHVSDNVKNKILKVPYSEQNDRLLILYAMGIVSEDILENLILFNNADWLNDVISFENRVRENEEKEVETEVNRLSDVFICCANSRKFNEMSGIDFDSMESLLESEHLKVVDGFIHTSKELMTFLQYANADFGFYDKDEDAIHIEASEFTQQIASSSDYDILSERTPFPLDYSMVKCCLSIFGKIYDTDFLEYVKEHNIPFDNNFEDEYEKYINEVKCRFDIKAYSKKRSICGNNLNVFDYTTQTIIDNKINEELTPDKDHSTIIRINASENLSDDELLKSAIEKYTSNRQPLENMIVDILHYGKTYKYICRNGILGRFTDDELEKFYFKLFDFDKIFAVITECSQAGQLRRKGDTIYMSSEYIEKIPIEWQCYADQIIMEQYGRRKRNMIAAALNDLKNAVSQKAERKQPVIGTPQSNNNGGN